jgi:PspA associated protein B
VGFLDTLLGRTKPVQPNLDVLFQLPSAAVTLEAATGFTPTGTGSVCFRPVEGKAFADVEKDVRELVTDLHAVNSALVDNGFGPQLLCTLVAFRDDRQRRLGLVYLFKRGTFYPFAPLDGQRRDSALELQVRGAVEGELKMEQDLSRWFPVWGAPGL